MSESDVGIDVFLINHKFVLLKISFFEKILNRNEWFYIVSFVISNLQLLFLERI